MNKAGTVATIEISPKAGSTTAFATVELTGTCANAGLYKVTGVVYAQATNATGVFANVQELISQRSDPERRRDGHLAEVRRQRGVHHRQPHGHRPRGHELGR